MYRLRRLDLSNNGLQNRGIHMLCEALRGHHSLTSLDVSGLPWVDATARQQLRSMPKMKRVVQTKSRLGAPSRAK